MDYKTMMGYGKKSKVKTKKITESKPSLLTEINNEFKDYPLEKIKKLNEVGNAQVHKKYILKIEDGAGYLESAVKNYSDFLKQQGHKKEAQEVRGAFSYVGKFTHWMKTKWVRMLRKLI